MNAEDLKKLGIEDEGIQKQIIILHGKGIEGLKAQLQTATQERDNLSTQLTDASKTIADFKGMDVAGIQKSVEEWKTRAQDAEANAAKQIAEMKFNIALETALGNAKAKNVKAVKALVDHKTLTLGEDGTIAGLNDQLEKIKAENDFLFEGDKPAPKIVTGGTQTPTNADPIVAAARAASGLDTKSN